MWQILLSGAIGGLVVFLAHPFLFNGRPAAVVTKAIEPAKAAEAPKPVPYAEKQIYGLRFFAEWNTTQEKQYEQPWFVCDPMSRKRGHYFRVGTEENALRLIDFLEAASREPK